MAKQKKEREYRGVIDEIREQQRKLKDMTWKERFDYYLEYYKYHTLAIIVVAILLIYTIHTFVSAKDFCFYGMMLNAQALSSEALETSFAEYAGLDTDEYECFIDAESTLSYQNSTEYDYATMQRIVATVQTKDLDAVVFDAECFQRYAINEIFIDLRTVLSEDEIAKYEKYFYYLDMEEVRRLNEAEMEVDVNKALAENAATMEDVLAEAETHRDPSAMVDPVPVGIYMDQSPFTEGSLGYIGYMPIFGISATTQRPDTAVAYLNYLWDESIDFKEVMYVW